jgi:hypothetical protein
MEEGRANRNPSSPTDDRLDSTDAPVILWVDEILSAKI